MKLMSRKEKLISQKQAYKHSFQEEVQAGVTPPSRDYPREGPHQ